MAEDICFYRANEKPFGVFSNLYHCPVEFEGRTFMTAEHAYQYGKARKQDVRDWLAACPSPSVLATSAHALLPWDVVEGWKDKKVDRMHAVVCAKFEQNPELAEILLSTGSARLVECGTTNNAVNRFWGQVAGKGENWLGRILMDVRSKIASERRLAVSPPCTDSVPNG